MSLETVLSGATLASNGSFREYDTFPGYTYHSGYRSILVCVSSDVKQLLISQNTQTIDKNALFAHFACKRQIVQLTVLSFAILNIIRDTCESY